MVREMSTSAQSKAQTGKAQTGAGVKRDIWYPKESRLRSQSAADRAIRIARVICGKESGDSELDEQTLFVALHTCAYRAMRRPRRRNISGAARAAWLRRRRAICTYIVERNLGLVYLCIGRFRSSGVELDELRSEGLLALVRAVDWFNPWRGIRFSTYAYNAIIRGLVRLSQRAGRHRRLFPSTYEVPVPPSEPEDRWAALYVDRLYKAMKDNLGDLTDREYRILRHRFPIGSQPRMTLSEVGDVCGLSKERVRQIQNRALQKLRNVLEADPILQ